MTDPADSRTFADLGIPAVVVHELNAAGITSPFPIQLAAIPDALAGRDVLGRGPTGSGKTLTFGLPMIVRLAGAPSTPGHPRGLVLVPTRELALQVGESLEAPAAAMGMRIGTVIGGVGIGRHRDLLTRPVDILVATPGRAQDLIDQKVLHLDAVRVTALDEADHMADMGFLPQVRRLLDRTPRDGQRLLFSATLDGDVKTLVDRYLTDPCEHATAPPKAGVTTMEHHLLHVTDKDAKKDVVARIAAREGKTIMFTRTKYGADRVAKQLRRVGIAAAPLHGGKAQGNRTRTLAGFASGEVPVLVCTDVAARGIHVDDVSLVVHVDPPADPKDYLHRAGRTARAGESGRVVTIVMPDQRDEVAGLMRKAGVTPVQHRVAAGSAELAEVTGARPPSGKPLPPPNAPAPTPPKAGGPGTRAGAGGRGSGRRSSESPRGGSTRGAGAKGGSGQGGAGRSEGGQAASRGRRPRPDDRSAPANPSTRRRRRG